MAIEKKFIDDSIIKANISKFLSKELSRAGFSRVEIQKTPVLTRITVHVLNPGKVIGRAGKTIDELTDAIKKRFNVNNPQISVVEIDNKMLEPLHSPQTALERMRRNVYN